MKKLTFLVAILVGIVLNFETGESAIVPKNNGVITIRVPGKTVNETRKENITMEALEEAVEDYIDLSDAFYSPAESEAVREKRTLRIFRTLANRTRSGIRSLRRLFSGRRRNEDSDDAAPMRGGFRKFFSGLLNRILVFMTTLWDRITGFFRGGRGGGDGDEEGSSASPSLLTRLRMGAASLAKTFRNRGNNNEGGSSSGSGGFLSNIGGFQGLLAAIRELNPQSTIKPYEIDYDDADKNEIKTSEDDKSSTATEKPEVASTADSISDTAAAEAAAEAKVSSNYESSSGGYSTGSGYTGSNAVRSHSDAAYSHSSDNAASASWQSGSFVPFPMDSDPNYHLNGARATNYYTIPVNSWSTRSRRTVSSGTPQEYYSYGY